MKRQFLRSLKHGMAEVEADVSVGTYEKTRASGDMLLSMMRDECLLKP